MEGLACAGDFLCFKHQHPPHFTSYTYKSTHTHARAHTRAYSCDIGRVLTAFSFSSSSSSALVQGWDTFEYKKGRRRKGRRSQRAREAQARSLLARLNILSYLYKPPPLHCPLFTFKRYYVKVLVTSLSSQRLFTSYIPPCEVLEALYS